MKSRLCWACGATLKRLGMCLECWGRKWCDSVTPLPASVDDDDERDDTSCAPGEADLVSLWQDMGGEG